MDSSKLLSLLFVGGTALLGGCIYKYFSRADIVTILSNHSDIDTKRRENINNTDTYEEICQETLNQ